MQAATRPSRANCAYAGLGACELLAYGLAKTRFEHAEIMVDLSELTVDSAAARA